MRANRAFDARVCFWTREPFFLLNRNRKDELQLPVLRTQRRRPSHRFYIYNMCAGLHDQIKYVMDKKRRYMLFFVVVV